MPRRVVVVNPNFASRVKELREQRRLSLRRLGQQIHCSHGYLWDLEAGNKNPSVKIAALIDTALGAAGELSAMVYEVSADSPEVSAASQSFAGPPLSGLEFAPDWRHGIDVATELWRGDMQRRHLLRGAGFSAAAYLTPAMRWLTSSLDERPSGDGQQVVGEPDIEMVRRITGVYRTLDNQFGGGHVRESVVRFLDSEVAVLLRGRYGLRTGRALLAAAAEATQLAGWTTYDVGMNGLAQRYMVQALRLAAAAGDRALGAEILAAMSHQAAYMRASTEAVDLARAAGRAAADAGVAAIQAESAVLEAQGHAVGRDSVACAAALDRAERALDRADRTSDPQWLGYFDEAYLAAKFGHCFTALGRGDLAERFAVKSLEMDGQRYARGRQFNLALLAAAHAQTGDPEQASVIGLQAVEAAEGLHSARARDYLRDLANRLSPHVGLPHVRAFAERVRPLLQVAR
jgi:transcriptional regulator with XRE-family HTH domain